MRERRASLKFTDLDGDGRREIVLRNDDLYAVLSPHQGGRLIYLFTREPRGGALVIGNPTDDWNLQEELNRYMDRPSNHPGALADVGFEHDRYRTSYAEADSYTIVEMTNVQAGSRMYGVRKTVLLAPEASALLVCYRLPGGLALFDTEACLSPDYYRLLRRGRSGLRATSGGCWRGARNEDVGVWVGLAHDEDTHWQEPASPEVGHGLNVRVRARSGHFHLLIGCGDIDEESCQELFREGREILHRVRKETTRITVRRKRVVARSAEVGHARRAMPAVAEQGSHPGDGGRSG